MKQKAVAVLDVGKTNKKFRLFGRGFTMLRDVRINTQSRDLNGIDVEDSPALLAWFQERLKEATPDFDIKAIAITTHGATAVLLDENGALAHPVISYTADKGLEVQDEFYDVYGTREELHRVTCTADVGFANLGKMLYLVKTRLPEVWARCKHALFYDSYFGYELTGHMGLEHTYLGNHTYLWNFAGKDWSSVGRDLRADQLFPKNAARSWECLGVVKPEIAQACGLSENCKVTYGIHDSNANYLPYIALGYDNFLLNSSGTWCVLMTPAHQPFLTDTEIAAKVFFNLDAFGRPVKTSIFPAGMEYDTFRSFTELPDKATTGIVRDVIAKEELFVVPGVVPDSSAYIGAISRIVNGGQVDTVADLKKKGGTPMTPLGQAYNGAVNLSLALATREALNKLSLPKGTTVFIEGGFANNIVYCELLATLCPDLSFALTNIKEGTSFGAAMTAWMCAEGLSLDEIGKEISIETRPISRQDYGDMDSYLKIFDELVKA